MTLWKYGVVIGLPHDSVIFLVTVFFANFIAILQFFKASVDPVHPVQNSWKFYQFFFSWGRTFLFLGRVNIQTFSKSWGVWCTLTNICTWFYCWKVVSQVYMVAKQPHAGWKRWVRVFVLCNSRLSNKNDRTIYICYATQSIKGQL